MSKDIDWFLSATPLICVQSYQAIVVIRFANFPLPFSMWIFNWCTAKRIETKMSDELNDQQKRNKNANPMKICVEQHVPVTKCEFSVKMFVYILYSEQIWHVNIMFAVSWRNQCVNWQFTLHYTHLSNPFDHVRWHMIERVWINSVKMKNIISKMNWTIDFQSNKCRPIGRDYSHLQSLVFSGNSLWSFCMWQSIRNNKKIEFIGGKLKFIEVIMSRSLNQSKVFRF